MAINVASANNFRPIHLDHLSLQPSASFIRIYGSLYFICMDITGWMSLDISFIIIIHHTCWGRAILFQGNSISGLFFLIAIAVNSRINAFYTALGSILPIVVAVLSGMDHAILNAGLIGYNGVLCAIALGDKTIRSGAWCVCSILISILLQWLGMHWGITTLTAPFVISVWITIILKRSLEKTV